MENCANCMNVLLPRLSTLNVNFRTSPKFHTVIQNFHRMKMNCQSLVQDDNLPNIGAQLVGIFIISHSTCRIVFHFDEADQRHGSVRCSDIDLEI